MNNKYIRLKANELNSLNVSYFTGIIKEGEGTDGSKPKKIFKHPKEWQNIKIGEWNEDKVENSHNGIAIITGSNSNNILLIDWDLKKWNIETKAFEINYEIYEIFNYFSEILEPFLNKTYVESTGNGGFHWLFRYNPKDIGFLIKSQPFKYNGIICGDIKAEKGCCYLAPTNYKGIDGIIKEYIEINDFNIV